MWEPGRRQGNIKAEAGVTSWPWRAKASVVASEEGKGSRKGSPSVWGRR